MRKAKHMAVDKDKLRNDLMDYYGTAMMSPFPMAVIDLGKVEKASDSELVNMARKAGFNMKKYEK